MASQPKLKPLMSASQPWAATTMPEPDILTLQIVGSWRPLHVNCNNQLHHEKLKEGDGHMIPDDSDG